MNISEFNQKNTGKSKSQVAVVYCPGYDAEHVYNAVCAGIDAIGGIESFVHPDESILIKPNFLVASDPDKAVVTHPSVIEAVCRILREHNYANVCCGDSPGHGSMENALRLAGLDAVFDKYDVKPADMEHESVVDFPEGAACRQFYFTRAAAECDAIISVSKMKTHALERITGAVKNMYGTVCGYRKAAGHVKFPNAVVFARMLADIHRCLKPRLHIMDGITAMEGNGPGSGTPVNMNVLLFSADPVALDTVYCRLIDMDPILIPTNVQGENLGIGHYHHENIEILDINDADTDVPEQRYAEYDRTEYDHAETGKMWTEEKISFDELFEKYGNPHFDADRTGTKKTLLSRFSDIMTETAKRPYILKELCIRCGVCTEHCPVPGRAVDFADGRDKPPAYDYKKCIRCYCCQEMCPRHAIHVKRQLF